MVTDRLPSSERRSARLSHLNEARKEALWILPLLGIVGAVVLSQITGRLDLERHRSLSGSTFFTENVDDARAVVSTIGSSTLTFLGVVFSIALVALQMASSQYSPRVVRRFVRSRTTKLTLATFIGTYVYCLIVLGSFQTAQSATDTTFVPVVSVFTAQLLALGCLGVFVAFAHNTVRSMRVSYVIKSVADETRASIRHNAPWDDRLADIDPGELGPPDHLIRLDRHPGVLAGIDIDDLLLSAVAHDAVFRVLPMVGTYLSGDAPVVEVHGPRCPPTAAVVACFDIGAERTLYQDSSYGLRQLVDIAIRALSPAVNDPTTAAQVIDRLVDLLVRLGQRERRHNVITDDQGTVRLLFSRPSWERQVDLAFTEIRIYGTTSPQITRRLMSGFDHLVEETPAAAHPAIEAQRDLLIAAVHREVADPAEQAIALRPDARGLG